MRFKQLHCQALTDLVGMVLRSPFPDGINIYRVPVLDDPDADPLSSATVVADIAAGNYFAEKTESGCVYTVVYFVDRHRMKVTMTDVDVFV